MKSQLGQERASIPNAADVTKREPATRWDGPACALPEVARLSIWRKSDALYPGLRPFSCSVWRHERGDGASHAPDARLSGRVRLGPCFGPCLCAWTGNVLPGGAVRRLWPVFGSFAGIRARRTRAVSQQCETRWLGRQNLRVDLVDRHRAKRKRGLCSLAIDGLRDFSTGTRASRAVAGEARPSKHVRSGELGHS